MNSHLSRKHLATVLIGVVLAAGAFVAACGDDDGGGAGGITLDPAKADSLAHSAMLTEKDLPGSGWTVSATDEFEDSGVSLGDAPSCKKVEATLTKSQEKTDAARAGRAEKEFERESDESPLPTSVEVQVNIFKDAKTPSEALDTFKGVLGSGDFETCLKDVFSAAAAGAEGLKVTSKSVAARIAAPADGVAKAYLISISVSGFSLDMRLELYLWRYGNVGTTLTLSGPDSEITEELAKAAVGETQAKLEAARGK